MHLNYRVGFAKAYNICLSVTHLVLRANTINPKRNKLAEITPITISCQKNYLITPRYKYVWIVEYSMGDSLAFINCFFPYLSNYWEDDVTPSKELRELNPFMWP